MCFISTNLFAQSDYSHTLEGIEWVKIKASNPIKIQAQGKQQLVIKADNLEKLPEKAKGLKLVGAGGMDNTGLGFNITKVGSDLMVNAIGSMREQAALLYLPASTKIVINGSGIQSDIDLSGFTGEIEASTATIGDIKITDVTGPITANTSTGDIQVVFNKVNQSSPISISTATGEVDVSLPSDTPASISLHSTMGGVYTDFNLNIPEKRGLKALSSKEIEGEINDGGVSIQLNSATGNIYLRKQ